MAERRMFAKSVVLTDRFMAMPAKIRCLYYTLGMSADDDGFVGNPKAICRLCGTTAKDLQVLCDQGYVYLFDSGVAALNHWRVCNLIRADRYKPTDYLEERDILVKNSLAQYRPLDLHG